MEVHGGRVVGEDEYYQLLDDRQKHPKGQANRPEFQHIDVQEVSRSDQSPCTCWSPRCTPQPVREASVVIVYRSASRPMGKLFVRFSVGEAALISFMGGQPAAARGAATCLRDGSLPSSGLGMLATMITALFFIVRVFGQISTSLFQEERLPYLPYQPHPWQIQYVTHSRRASVEKSARSRQTSRPHSTSPQQGNASAPSSHVDKHHPDPEKAALTIQTHFRKYQEHKHHKD